MTCSKANFAASSVTLCFPQARVALPLNTFLWGDQADAIEDGNNLLLPTLILRRHTCYVISPSTWSLWNQVRRLPVKELNMTALQGWIVIGLLVLIMLGIVGIGAEIKALPYLWRTETPSADLER